MLLEQDRFGYQVLRFEPFDFRNSGDFIEYLIAQSAGQAANGFQFCKVDFSFQMKRFFDFQIAEAADNYKFTEW